MVDDDEIFRAFRSVERYTSRRVRVMFDLFFLFFDDVLVCYVFNVDCVVVSECVEIVCVIFVSDVLVFISCFVGFVLSIVECVDVVFKVFMVGLMI